MLCVQFGSHRDVEFVLNLLALVPLKDTRGTFRNALEMFQPKPCKPLLVGHSFLKMKHLSMVIIHSNWQLLKSSNDSYSKLT